MVAFVVGSAALERDRVALALRGTVDRVLHCPSLSDVDVTGTNRCASVIVIAPDASPTPVLLSAVRHFRRNDTAAALLLCLPIMSRTTHQLATLARAGLDAVVPLDEPRTWDRLRTEVSRRLKQSLPVQLVRQGIQVIDLELQAYCSYCFRNGFRDLKVSQVAEWFQYDPTTVNRHLRKGGLRSLEHLIDCGRLLHAAYHLDTDARVETIARSLRFPSAATFANDVRRWSGHSPSDLRARGAVDAVVQLINDRLFRATSRVQHPAT